MDADVSGSVFGATEDDKKVLIIGAGITGLALAHGLKKAGIPYAVYESRSNVATPKRDWNFALHWSAPAMQSLIPGELWARIQSAQVDPHTPTKDVDTLRIHNGKTGELMTGLELKKFYRLRRSKLQALLSEGLNIHWEKTLVDIAYLEDGSGVKAIFDDGTQVTGSTLIGADGPRSSVRSLLVGPDNAKPTPIDFATTIFFTSYPRDRALFLASEPHHPLYQVATHPDGYYSWLGLHDASDPSRPESWVFWGYISYAEPRDFINTKTLPEHVAHQKALAAQFVDPWKSAVEWIPDDDDIMATTTTATTTSSARYTKLTHWDPALPEHRWDNHSGLITLAGDAAHPMTFQRGQGLNHAVTDSAKLCAAIVEAWNHGDDEGFGAEEGRKGRAAAIETYESEMIGRASEEVRLGETNSNMLHDWEEIGRSPLFGKGIGR